MDPESLFSILTIFAMVVLGMFLSAAETAFSALNRVRIKSFADDETDPKRAKRAGLVIALHDKFDKLLSTLLILNNAVTVIAAAVSTLLFVRLIGDELGPTLSTIAITFVVVFIGDITPKSLAKEAPERFAMATAPLLNIFIYALTPANWFFGKWKILLSSVVSNSEEDDKMTEEELYSYVEEAQNDGLIDEDGRQLLDNAIEFNELRAIDILTPRMDLVGISEDASEEEIGNLFLESEYSRLPVYRETFDNIVGLVHMRDFLKYKINRGELKEIFTEPFFVAPSAHISDLFKQLQENKSHLAFVTDEYGGTAGIITMEDILEELVGDIWDEADEIIVEFEALGENRHRVMCSAYVKDMFAYFDLPEDPEADSTSVSGWIMDKLAKLPEEGDELSFKNLRVEVSKTESRRVIECIVSVVVEEENPDEIIIENE